MDAISLDQLRVFEAVVETGSFSAAARRLRRVQSAVSYAIGNLESQLGVALFERGHQRPILTDAGKSVLGDARAVALKVDALRLRVRGLRQGLETELALAVDVIFPMAVLVEALDAFRHEFPTVAVRLYVEALGAVPAVVQQGICRVGIMGTLPTVPDGIEAHALAPVTLIPCVTPEHALAAHDGPIPTALLREHIQLVLTDRSDLTQGRDFGVLSARTWRLADLGAKHALLRAGLGWGTLPEHLAAPDLASGRLVQLRPAEWLGGVFRIPMQFIHRADEPLGPAANWFLTRISRCAATAQAQAG
jgi:DNA-binding transcriptional LysR family regulator